MWAERIQHAVAVLLTLILAEVIALAVVFSGPAPAHEAPPALIDVTLEEQDVLSVRIKVDLAGFLARADGVDHEKYDGLARETLVRRLNEIPEHITTAISVADKDGPLPVAAKGIDADGRLDLVVIDAPRSQSIEVTPSTALGPAVIRLFLPGSDVPYFSAFAKPDEGTPIALSDAPRPSAASVAIEYVVAGFDHILPKGLDHILFVIGLFLLSPTIRALAIQVSLFTAAHTTTLALAATGLVSVPATIVEPLIAGSIAFIAIENILKTSLSRWRPWVVFGFGLLHGLGFASVLGEFGLPTGQFAVALVAFNIGVEIGQITVLAACFIAVALIYRRPWYRTAISIPASLIIAGIGVFWMVERVAGGIT